MLAGDESHVLRTVFWIATVPAFVAVAVLLLFVHEPTGRPIPTKPQLRLHWQGLHRLGSAFWFVVILGGVFAFTRFSEAFLILRATDGGLALRKNAVGTSRHEYRVCGVGLSIRQAGGSDRSHLAVGKRAGGSDRLGCDFGADATIKHDLCRHRAVGAANGLTQGLFSAMVADAAPAELRGSAFGVFHFVTGIATLLSSVLAGLLWAWSGPDLTFRVGAAISAAALCGLVGGRSRFRKAL